MLELPYNPLATAIMAPVSNVHTRSHSLLLLQKLLNLRDGASPLTLLLDNLEQPCHAVVSEFITRAKVRLHLFLFFPFLSFVFYLWSFSLIFFLYILILRFMV